MNGKQIIVSAGIIRHKGKILIAQRKKDASLEAGKWEFPGGKVELFEDPKKALKREITEELELEINVLELLDVSCHNYTKKRLQVIMLVYFAEYLSGKIKPNVHDDVIWVNISDLKKFDFANADNPLVEKLVKRKQKS